MDHSIPLITTIATALGMALVLGFLATRLRLPALVGYLLAGVVIGPYTPGFVADIALASELAEIGVMLLMFGVGLHFSFADLLAVRRIAVPGAVVQIAAATGMGMALALYWDWSLGAALVWIVVGDVDAQWSNFADTAQGAQLISMTGRDQIWALAIEEWRASPLFGYGPSLWDADFRAAIAMPNATSAHNQFMDTLARSGTIGAAGLVAYSLVLLGMSLRYAKASGGLSLALFVALALRSISEVPMLLQGYGTELFLHLLLLITISAAASSRVQVQTARSPYAWGAMS